MIEVPFELDDRPVDTGVIQIDSLRLDAAATIEAAAAFHAALDQRAEEEAARLLARDVALVVSDAPPLACAAAARAGIRSVVTSNFTWDWIYQAYDEHLHRAPDLISTIQDAYRLADQAWRLPLYGGFESFESIVDVPFVAHHSTRAPEDTRARLALPLDRRLVLPSFGGYGLKGLDPDAVVLPEGWAMVRRLGQTELYDVGLTYQDLVRAVDVVITKPGYGIVAECIANATAMVYTSRGRFAEYDVFVREMPRYVRCAFIDNETLLQGRWEAAVEAAFHASAVEQPRTDGAEVIAAMMESWI